MLLAQSSRALLAGVMIMLLFAPMAAAFAAAGADQHSCCHRSGQQASQPQEQCCYISNDPGPAPAATTPVRTWVGDHHVITVVLGIATAISNNPDYTSAKELSATPPDGLNLSSVLRI